MNVKLTWMLAFFFAALQFSFAQDKTVTGTVKDASGVGLPGVAILVKGENTGTQTDFDGNYSITVGGGKTLVFSYLGSKTEERIVGVANRIDVTLQDDTQQLDEVVVTALGVTRDKQSIGYAAQSVAGDNISKSGQLNALNALSGNVAGLQITSPSSMGGSTRIVLRGVGSVTGENRPLIVIDGIPMDNGNYNTTGAQRGGAGRDYGDATADINPDDIESVTVLRGGPAAALYGSRGGNGVILYTTKSGKNGRTDIDVKSGITFESIYIYPNLQKLYGGGDSNTFATQTINGTTYNVANYAYDESWGPKYDGTMYLPWYAFDPEFPDDYMKTVPWEASKNDVDKFFRTGITYSNSVSFSRSVQDTNLRLSFANNQTQGVVPNSRLDRSNLNFNFNSKFTEKLRLDGSFNYAYTRGFNRPEQGYGDNSVAQKFWQWGQRQLDMEKLKDYKLADGSQRTWNRTSWDDATPVYSDNPYWVINENTSEDKRHRFFGNVGLTYNFTNNLYAVGKVYGDTYSSRIWERVAIGSQATSSFSDIKRSVSDYTYEGRLHFDHNLSADLSLNAFAGVARRERRYDYVYGTTVGGLVMPNLYNLANSSESPNGQNLQNWKRTNSVFGMVSLGYKNILFVEGTARNDWFSTVTESVFYPSVTGSFVFSSLVKQPWLNFGKLRLGWAQVGNDTDPYRLETYADIRVPFGSDPRYSFPETANNRQLIPEIKTTKEIGLELSLFSRRVTIDATYYDTVTDDLIMPLAIDPATGFRYKYVNGGSLQNKGIELTVGFSPVRTDNFNWDVAWNFTKNNNKLLSLAETSEYQITTAPFRASLYAKVGEPYGQIYGTDFVYHETTGKPIVDATGRYVASGVQALGSVIPDYNTGLRNTFSYKNASLSVLFDMQKGGVYYSTSHMWGMYSGMLEASAANNVRENGIILDAVYANGTPNTTSITAIRWGGDHYSRVDAQNVFDASYLKLREVTLSYKLPLPENKHVKEVTLSAFGRNLWATGLDWKGMDPENTSYGSGNIQGLEGGSLPSTRTYGMNVQIKL